MSTPDLKRMKLNARVMGFFQFCEIFCLCMLVRAWWHDEYAQATFSIGMYFMCTEQWYWAKRRYKNAERGEPYDY